MDRGRFRLELRRTDGCEEWAWFTTRAQAEEVSRALLAGERVDGFSLAVDEIEEILVLELIVAARPEPSGSRG